jgi:hypothetical protein
LQLGYDLVKCKQETGVLQCELGDLDPDRQRFEVINFEMQLNSTNSDEEHNRNNYCEDCADIKMCLVEHLGT